MRAAFLGFLAALLIAGPAEAQVSGRGNVITSDSIQLGPNVYRLYGIDAVDFHQFCFVDGEPWACGAPATRAFQELLDIVTITCVGTGEVTPTGEFATCTSDLGDVAEYLVAEGWAFAVPEQTDAYVEAEAAARAEHKGIWRDLILPPWEYREDIAAIERHLASRAAAALPALGTESLTTNTSYVPIIEGFEVTTDATDGIVVSFANPEIREGFIFESIPDRGVFDWREPAAALRDWRGGLVARLHSEAQTAVIRTMSADSAETISTSEGGAYYRALAEHAAPMIEAGVQPILIIIGTSNPSWFADWFGASPPTGAVITHRDDIEDATYMGTIDGIDVYRGVPPPGETYLLAEDAIEAISFVANEDGTIVSLERNTAPDDAELLVQFTLDVQWSDAPITTILYPYEQTESPYGS